MGRRDPNEPLSTRSVRGKYAESSVHGSTGMAPQAWLYMPSSAGADLLERLCRHVSTQALLYRHSSTGKRRATHSRRLDAVKPSPKYAETTRRADVGVSGASPKARQADLVRLRRHGFTATLQARLDRTQRYRRGSTQARLYSGLALSKHGFTGVALYRQGSAAMALKGTTLQPRLYRQGPPETALQARLCRCGFAGAILQARLFRHGCVRLHV